VSIPLRRIESGIQTAKTGVNSSGLLYNATSSGTTYSQGRNVPLIQDTEITHPFKVSLYQKEDGWYANIVPGTINSLVPLIGNSSGADGLMTSPTKPELKLVFSNNQSFIYIKAGNAGFTWPDDNFGNVQYPRIPSGNDTQSKPSDSDNYAYFLIATISKNPDTEQVYISQFIQKIIWSERHKFTEPNSAYYIYWTL
jgi:hypothetical protein